MAKKNISGSSIVLNQDIHFKGERTEVRTRSQACTPVEKGKTAKSIDVSAFVPLALGAIPICGGSGAASPFITSALGAITAAAMIRVKQTSGRAQFSTNYVLALMKVVNGAYAKNGQLSEEYLQGLLSGLLSGLLEKAGPAYSSYKQVLKDAMQAETLPAFLKGVQPLICAFTGDPVNANTGNFIYEKADLEIGGRLPLLFRRFYNRLDTRKGSMGKGWRHNYEIELLIEKDRYTLVWDDGREEVYLRTKDGMPEALSELPCHLKREEQGFSYQTREEVLYSFSETGKLQRKREKNGRMLHFAYDGKGRLCDVRGTGGIFLHYEYDYFCGMLSKVTDHTGRSVCLRYELGRLKEVTGADTSRYCYDYYGDGSIRRIRNPRDIYVLENVYDDKGRVTEQKFADGGKIRYDYQEELSRTFVVDQNGGRTAYVHDERFRNVRTIYLDGEETFRYNERNQLVSKTDKNGNKTQYAYDDHGNTTQILFPDGSRHHMTYDAGNRLLVLSVNGSRKWKNTYDKKGNLIAAEDALGRKRIMEYDEEGNVTGIILPDDSRISLEYDEKGNILSVTDGAGSTTSYTYDACSRVTATVDGNGNRTSFAYDACGRITAVMNAEGKTRTYAYTKNGKVTRITDFNGAVTSQVYNEMNQVTGISLPDGGVINLEYDLMQNVTRRTLPTGGSVRYRYDRLNRLEQVILPTGGAVHYEYDSNGNRTAVTDPQGNRTTMEYDELNRMVSVTDPEGARSTYEYDMEGNLTRVTNPMGQSHTYEYDGAGQKIRETDMVGNTVSYEYNGLGKVCCVTDPLNRKTTYEYDKGGHLAAITYPNGDRERYRYDKNGNLIRRENQNGEFLTFTYDCMDRVIKVSSSFGQEKRYTYDAVGHVTSMTDTLGHVTQYEYSPGGKLTAVTDAAGNKTEYAYDLMGNLITVCQHEGSRTLLSADAQKSRGEAFGYAGGEKMHITRYERDLMGNVTTVINPLGQKEQYTYDEAGHLLSKTDREGYRTNYRYNGRGDLEEISYNDSRSVRYSYNALRQLTEIKDWLGITRIELDEAGRAKQITDYKGREVRYQWGRLGERTGLVYPDGRKVSYEYDEWSRLSRLIDGNREIQYHYREDGRLSEKVFSDGLITSYDYNEMGLISGLIHQQGEKKLEEYRYTYDLMGNKTRIEKRRAECFRAEGVPEEISRKLSQERGIYQYRYDKLNRLTEVLHGNETVSSYTYDAFGNRIQSRHGYEERRYEYNGANQMVRSVSGGRVEYYQYDKRGNLTEIVRDDKAIHRYRYDETNRLAEAVNGSGQAVRYEYNGLGNRVGRQEYRLEGFAGGGTLPENPVLPKDPVKETEYLLDLTKPYHNLLERREATEGKIASQIYTWDSNVVYATEGESAYLYLQDELGSPVRLVKVQEDNSQEMRQTVYGYDEFGNDRYGTQGEVQPFGFTGYQKDTVADTYFAQMREYMPKEGRFGGEDCIKGSIARPFTLNPYGYCWGNPVGLVDFDGKAPVMWGRDDPRTWYVENWIQSADKVFRETGNEIQEAFNPANWIPNSSVQWGVNKLTGTDITETEAELIKKHPWGAKKVLQAASRADEWTDKIFGSYYGDIGNGQKHWLDGDPANAYRHAMWNAFITKYMGSGAEAKKWTDAHEAWPKEIMELQHGSGFTRQEHTNMDFFNNAVGRNAVLENGFDLSEEEISNIILEKLKNGEMKFIVDHGWYQDIIGCATSQ